jgi:hypothetical protein
MKIQWVRNMKAERKPATAKDGKKPDGGSKGGSDKASNAGESVSAQAGKEEKEEEAKIVFSVIPD